MQRWAACSCRLKYAALTNSVSPFILLQQMMTSEDVTKKKRFEPHQRITCGRVSESQCEHSWKQLQDKNRCKANRLSLKRSWNLTACHQRILRFVWSISKMTVVALVCEVRGHQQWHNLFQVHLKQQGSPNWTN